MKRNRTLDPIRGFSLIEVTMTVGVIAFALVGLMGILPVALEQSRTCINETRGAHMARMVFSTIQSESYKATKCFSTGGQTIDLSSLTESSAPVTLYATYQVRTGTEPSEGESEVPDGTDPEEKNHEIKIVRAAAPPIGTEYKLEITASPVKIQIGGEEQIRGQNLRLQISQVNGKKPFFQAIQFVSRLQRGVQPL